MSFILDALKKSENDRQRQSGPALFEVRVAPPRSKLPMLAIIIVSLLVVNLGVVGWIMLRKPAVAAAAPAPVAAAPAATAPAQFNAQQSAPAQPQGYAQNPPPQGYAQYAPGSMPPPNNIPPQGYNQAGPNNGYPPPNGYAAANGYQQNGYPQNGANNGYAPPGQNNGGAAYAPNQEPSLADQGAGPGQQERYNPDDYAPARDAPPPGTGAGRVTRGTMSGLPTYEEAATQTSIPPLHMDLHSYAADPTKRFVLINMRRLYEGQALPEGPKVESINNDSAIMSYNGKRFVLNKD